MDIKRVGEAKQWINGHRRSHPTEHARQHPRALARWWRPHVVLRHHGLGETNKATVLAVVNVDLPDLAGPDDAGNDFAVVVLNINENRRTRWVEIPHIVRDVLEVADIFAGIEIKRHQRLRVEIVAGSNRTLE